MAELMSRYSNREKLIVFLALIVLGGVALHALLIEPYQNHVSALEEQLTQADSDLKWMKSMVHQIPVKSGATSRSSFDGTLANLINQLVRQQRLNSNLAQMTPRGDDEIRVRFSAVPFEKLIRFVATINDQGLMVKDLRINAADNPGLVDSNLVLNKG